MTRETEIALRGPYDLREVALMGFGHRDETTFDGVMRLAFCADADLDRPVGVEVRQAGDRLQLVVHDRPDRAGGAGVELASVAAQVARIVSADGDGAAYARVCAGDPVLARVHDAAPGFRPALFCSAYEALVWSLLSARRSRAQGATLRRRLAERSGTTFDLAGVPTPCVPGPTALAALDALPGLPAAQVPRLRAVALAARDGRLDTAELARLPHDELVGRLRALPGIGPFSAALVELRALGLTDALSVDEPRSREVVREAYALPGPPTDEAMRRIADGWRPFRTWALVALRAVGTRPGVLRPPEDQ